MKKLTENTLKVTEDIKIEEIIKNYYSSKEQKEFISEDIEILKKNRLFTMFDWGRLNTKQKSDLTNSSFTKYPIPISLCNLLDQVPQHLNTSNYDYSSETETLIL